MAQITQTKDGGTIMKVFDKTYITVDNGKLSNTFAITPILEFKWINYIAKIYYLRFAWLFWYIDLNVYTLDVGNRDND